MHATTREYLARAARNRDSARALFEHGEALGILPLPFEWAAVVAFYAAVHYVNAFLWDRQGYEPANHAQRVNAVNRVTELQSAFAAYERLRETAFRARYQPGFRATRADAVQILRHLDVVERTILTALQPGT